MAERRHRSVIDREEEGIVNPEALLGGPGTVATIGPERGSSPSSGDGIVRYISAEGSSRYVAYVGGSPVSMLQVVSRDGRHATIALVYTLKEFRRHGWAGKLLERARSDFQTVKHAPEEHLSTHGRGWRDAVGEKDGKLPPMADEAITQSRPTDVYPSSGVHPTSSGSYEGDVRRALIALGSNHPDGDLTNTGDFWKHCEQVGVLPENAAAVIYGTARHKHETMRATLKEAGAAEATETTRAESSTRDEWEVVVRRTDSLSSVTDAAGRKPSDVMGHNVVFGDFYDDERARDFARRMTTAGFLTMYGPRKQMVAAEETVAAEKSALRWTEVWWQHPVDGEKFAKELEKLNSTIVAVATNRIVRTNATGVDIERTIKKHRWHGKYILDDKTAHKFDLAAEGDSSAMGASEMAPVVSEATEVSPVISEGHIPWRKVERDPKAHEADMKLAEKYGPIGTPKKVYELVGVELSKEDSEIFLVIPLNVRGELKSRPYEVARGQRSRVTVGVDDVMRAVLDSGCEGFIVVHQHPSGKCQPSKADRELTAQIKKAAAPLAPNVKYLDHCVVGTKQIYSIEENKLYKCA